MTKASPNISIHSPDRFEHPGKPRGYSYQTRRVHSTWNDMETTIKRRAEQRGMDVEFVRDGDPRKTRGVRYSRCCERVQVKWEPCAVCGGIVGDR